MRWLKISNSSKEGDVCPCETALISPQQIVPIDAFVAANVTNLSPRKTPLIEDRRHDCIPLLIRNETKDLRALFLQCCQRFDVAALGAEQHDAAEQHKDTQRFSQCPTLQLVASCKDRAASR